METLSQLYFWSLFTAGIAISIWGYKRKKTKGYLLIAVFFLSPFVGLIQQKVSYQIHKEAIERMRYEQNKQLREMIGSSEIPIVTKKNITLPAFESLLVLGLLLTVLNSKTEPVASGQRR